MEQTAFLESPAFLVIIDSIVGVVLLPRRPVAHSYRVQNPLRPANEFLLCDFVSFWLGRH